MSCHDQCMHFGPCSCHCQMPVPRLVAKAFLTCCEHCQGLGAVAVRGCGQRPLRRIHGPGTQGTAPNLHHTPCPTVSLYREKTLCKLCHCPQPLLAISHLAFLIPAECSQTLLRVSCSHMTHKTLLGVCLKHVSALLSCPMSSHCIYSTQLVAVYKQQPTSACCRCRT